MRSYSPWLTEREVRGFRFVSLLVTTSAHLKKSMGLRLKKIGPEDIAPKTAVGQPKLEVNTMIKSYFK